MAEVVDPRTAEALLARRRVAVAGASAGERSFATAVYRELRERGYDVVAVNTHARPVLGDPCYPDLCSVPGPVDWVLVMVPADQAGRVVDDAIAASIPGVWFFKGLGPGAVSDDAVDHARRHGLTVVAGACPLMFLQPVRGVHRAHRALRRLRGSLAPATPRA